MRILRSAGALFSKLRRSRGPASGNQADYQPATGRQKNFADDLGIKCEPSISMAEMSVLISAGIVERDEQREEEWTKSVLAEIRAGKPDSPATKKQKQLANQLKVIYAVDYTKREIADAIEAKLIEKREERLRWRAEKKARGK